jgi:hypothetical protein
MRNTNFTITVPHLFSHISAFSAESNSYIIIFRFNIDQTLQINQSSFLIWIILFIQDKKVIRILKK